MHEAVTRIELPARAGLATDAVLATLARHATPGSEVVRGGRYQRLLRLSGTPTLVTLTVHPAGITLDAPRQAIEEAETTVRWWFDLDTDPVPIAARLAGDPRLTPLVRARPWLRPLRHPVGYEAAIDTVLGQQVTLSSARLFGERLRTAYSPGSVAGLRVFPEPDALAAVPVAELRAAVGLTTTRARTVHAVAALFADGFHLGPGTDPMTARQQLVDVRGVGPWTVEYLALRALGDPDAFPASDAVLRRALDGAAGPAAERLSEPWRPYRAWATAHLWASESHHPPSPSSRRRPPHTLVP